MKNECDVLILGAGFSGLSTSYHVGHERCIILESNPYAYGHCSTHKQDEVFWDEGPHVSFTNNEYVKDLFARSVRNNYAEYDVLVANYYKGCWIGHPAQVHLHQVDEPLRSKCVGSFLESRGVGRPPRNYGEWLDMAFGEVFARTFPASYTRKYWTCEPEMMESSWVGERVYCPNKSDVVEGSKGELLQKKHYITRVRYPKEGGYESFGQVFLNNANIRYNHNVDSIDLDNKKAVCSNGEEYSFKRLVSTIPLPMLVKACIQATDEVKEASSNLACTSGYLVNVVVPHKATRPENWLYVYDEEKLSTRITFAEKLDGAESVKEYSAIQVEVYYSRYRDINYTLDEIQHKVIDELYEMDLIDSSIVKNNNQLQSHITTFQWGNVIFDHGRRSSLDIVLGWLSGYGLVREIDDLEHNTLWEDSSGFIAGDVALAGRFAQWKYYWSDDCVLRGRQLGHALK